MGKREPNITFEEAQEIIRLRDVERKTFREIAEILGRSEHGVRKAYHRFKERMSYDRGELEARLIRAFKNGMSPTEAAEKLKIPLETVSEVWNLYKLLEEDAKIVKVIKGADLSKTYVEGLDLSLYDFLNLLVYKGKELNSTKSRLENSTKEIEEKIRLINHDLDSITVRLNDLEKRQDDIDTIVKGLKIRLETLNNEINRIRNAVENLYDQIFLTNPMQRSRALSVATQKREE